MSDRYIVVELTDGTILDFDKECTLVRYNDEHDCVFRNRERLFAVIPHGSIFSIRFFDR